MKCTKTFDAGVAVHMVGMNNDMPTSAVGTLSRAEVAAAQRLYRNAVAAGKRAPGALPRSVTPGGSTLEVVGPIGHTLTHIGLRAEGHRPVTGEAIEVSHALSEDVTALYIQSIRFGCVCVSSLGHLVTPRGQEGYYLAAYIRAEAGDTAELVRLAERARVLRAGVPAGKKVSGGRHAVKTAAQAALSSLRNEVD